MPSTPPTPDSERAPFQSVSIPVPSVWDDPMSFETDAWSFTPRGTSFRAVEAPGDANGGRRRRRRDRRRVGAAWGDGRSVPDRRTTRAPRHFPDADVMTREQVASWR